MTMSPTVSSSSAAIASVALGERLVINSEQVVTVSTTNGVDQNNNNNNTLDRNTSSLKITQSPEDRLGVLECEGDLMCDIWGNNTLVTTNTVGNTTNTTVITSALDTHNQSFTQSLNQSSIPLLPFDSNGIDDMLNNDSSTFNEREALDSKMDEWIDQMLNGTLGDLQGPLQTSPDLLPLPV